MTCAFDCNRQLALMACAGTGNSAGNNLRSVRKVSSELCNVFVVDMFDFVNTEGTDFFTASSAASASFVSLQSNDLL